MQVVDPHIGLGEYVCRDDGRHVWSCCEQVHELFAKCSVVDGYVDCLYRDIRNVNVNMTVVGGNIHVQCSRTADLELLMLVVSLLVTMACCWV